MASNLKNLFSPGFIGKMELKNRIIQAGMGTSLEPEDGTVDQRTIDFYTERARGGVALLIVGVGSIDHPYGLALTNQLGLSDDKFIPGLKKLADAVHMNGSKLAIQLHHAGKVSMSDFGRGIDMVSASELPAGSKEIMQDIASTEIPRLMKQFAIKAPHNTTIPLTKEQIKDYTRKYAEAALRCKKAGLDGVEIHAAHGYLIANFLSPYSNRRTDEYGGELNNRARFLLEIIAAIREKVGRDYPVWCRIDGQEFEIENGITIEDSKKLAPMLEAAGVDALHVSGYGGFRRSFYHAPICEPPAHLAGLAAEIKKVVNIPVIAVGRIDAEVGDKLIGEGKADFIAMARAILADPEYPNKVSAGRQDDVRPCIRCYNCVSQAFWNEPVFCTVNPAAGKESELRIEPIKQSKKVMIIGSGPGGMEAAIVATLRGHKVSIYEKGVRLGGSLTFASMASEANEAFLYYLIRQVKKLGIEVHFGTEVTTQLIDDIKPDAVIVANGCILTSPEIPGKARPNVITGADFKKMLNNNLKGEGAKMLTWWQKIAVSIGSPLLPYILTIPNIRKLSRIWLPIGKRVVVVGGDIAGVELAEFLAERGRQVTLIEEKDLAPEMSIARRWNFLKHLRDMKVTLINGVKYGEITDSGVSYSTKKGTTVLPADTVVITGGIGANTALYESIKKKVPQTFMVGDCRELRLIHGSVEDGYRAALAIQ
jgi:2,4-dienoyl-CoA reductase-like NADH-dependent reductase (Old Yellow Enzyme family)/thioredoxin reductase